MTDLAFFEGGGEVDDLSERMTRLEDALADFATLVTEAAISRPTFLVGSAAQDAGRRFAEFISAVRRERGKGEDQRHRVETAVGGLT